MKIFILICLLCSITLTSINAQSKTREQSIPTEINAKIITEFTGEVQNQFDSIFIAYIEVEESSLSQIESFVHVRGNKKSKNKTKEIHERLNGKVKIPLGQVTPDMDFNAMYFEDTGKNKVKIKFH